MVSIRNIVSVDFNIVTENKVLGDFETVVYFAPVVMQSSEGVVNKLVVTSLEDLSNITGNEAAVISMENYFLNGGKKLVVVSPTDYTAAGFASDIQKVREEYANDFIYVCISNQLISSGYPQEEFSKIVTYCDNSLSPEKVRLLLTTNSKTFIHDNGLENSFAAVKYSTKTADSNYIDTALLIGAYFSKVDLDDADSIKDYCYTKETLIGIDESTAAEGLTQTEFEQLVDNANSQGYYNIIDSVGANIVNFGGNLASNDNIAIHTDFGAIAIERDITYSVLEKMIGKQYLTEQGMSNVKAAINSNLQRYKTNGYLNLGAGYSGEDLTITYNTKKYNVIKNGQTLTQGFYIFSVPVADISVEDKQKKKFTPIYVILETQSGARVIEITGEVR